MQNKWLLCAFWFYLVLVVFGLVLPLWYQWRQPNKTYYEKNEANNFKWLTESERTKLNFFLNREKWLLDAWRRNINLLTIVQYYCTFWSVVSAILLAAIVPVSKDIPYSWWLVSLISIHLAITVGLQKAFKVEKTLQDGLKYEADFYELFYRFQSTPQDFGVEEERVAKFFREYEIIRKSLYETEVSALPSGQAKEERNLTSKRD